MIEARAVEVVKDVVPKPKILLIGHWIRFSNAFPTTLDHVRGKTMQITKQQQVRYELSWILKEGTYRDIDLSNDTGEKLYPNVAENLYEMLIGFKPGNYLVQIHFPVDYPIYRLDHPDMAPLITSSSLKYLGAIKPSDSPVENPVLKLYLVYKLTPVVLRIATDDGVDYEKVTIEFDINRCVMKEGTPPPHVEPKPILYLDEIKWYGLGSAT